MLHHTLYDWGRNYVWTSTQRPVPLMKTPGECTEKIAECRTAFFQISFHIVRWVTYFLWEVMFSDAPTEKPCSLDFAVKAQPSLLSSHAASSERQIKQTWIGCVQVCQCACESVCMYTCVCAHALGTPRDISSSFQWIHPQLWFSPWQPMKPFLTLTLSYRNVPSFQS